MGLISFNRLFSTAFEHVLWIRLYHIHYPGPVGIGEGWEGGDLGAADTTQGGTGTERCRDSKGIWYCYFYSVQFSQS